MRFPLLLLCALSLAACEKKPSLSSGSLVRSFGNFTSPDGSVTMAVSRRGKSLVDFAVVPSSGGGPLASGSVGSDAMRWFFYWEPPARLWAYGSDTGYFASFDFTKHGGSVAEKPVVKGDTIPKAVWDKIPGSLQADYRAK